METKAEAINENINNTTNTFYSALDDFRKYYVYYHKNPEVDEFQNYYSNSTGQLQNANKDLLLIINDIQNYIKLLKDNVVIMDSKLDDEKKLNNELSNVYKNLKNTDNGSSILINDSKKAYNTQYLKNIEMLVGILIMIGTMYKIFTLTNVKTM